MIKRDTYLKAVTLVGHPDRLEVFMASAIIFHSKCPWLALNPEIEVPRGQ